MANKADTLAEKIRRIFVKEEKPLTMDEKNMQRLEILKKNLFAQTAYSPEARKVISAIKFKITNDPHLYGQYNRAENTIYINPTSLKEGSTFPIENIRHEINHALDDNVRQANMVTKANSQFFYPEYQDTGNAAQKNDLQKFYNREFADYGQRKEGVPVELADTEGFAQTGTMGQNTMLEAPKGVKGNYGKIFTPASFPPLNYSPVYPETKSSVTPIKRKYTSQYVERDLPPGTPPEEQGQLPPQQNTGAESFQNAVGGTTPTGNPNWDSFVNAAKKVAQEMNFPLSVILGQAALETGRTSSPGNNFFGIKGAGTAGSNNLATKEATPEGQFYDTTSSFAAYKTAEDSIKAYIDLIKKRFPDAYAKKNDPNAMIEAIKAGGYATDPNYVAKVRSTPEFKQYANYRPAVKPLPKMTLPVMIGAPTPRPQPTAMPSAISTYRPPAQQASAPVPTPKAVPAPLRSISQSGSQTVKSSPLTPTTKSGLKLTI